eukprot:1319403-Amorphochlora_amoeboformis.AAC.2
MKFCLPIYHWPTLDPQAYGYRTRTRASRIKPRTWLICNHCSQTRTFHQSFLAAAPSPDIAHRLAISMANTRAGSREH